MKKLKHTIFKVSINVKRFFSFLKPYKKRVLLILFFTLTGSLLGLINPYITKLFIDDVLIEKNRDILIWLVIFSITSFFFRKAIDFFRSKYSMIVAERLFFDIALKLSEKVLNLPISYHKKNNVGYLTSRIVDDVESSQSILQSSVIDILSSLFTFFSGLTILFFLNTKLTILALAMLPTYVYSLHIYDGELKEKSNEIQESMASEMGLLQEIISAHFTLSIFNRIKYELRRIVRIHKTVIQSRFSLFYSQYGISVIIGFMTAMIPLIIMWFGVQEIYSNKLTIGEYIAFTAYINMVYSPASSLASLHITYRTVQAPIDRIFEILDMDNEIIESKNPSKIEKFKGDVSFENVSFEYSEEENWKLSDINFTIKSGESIAITGKSGSGKTTIINLLSRFYNPTSGKILIDGINIRNLKLSDLRNSIAYVSQEPFLFNDSILNNIKYGKLNASTSEVIEASKRANCYNFIMEFPEGFETKCGQRGVGLSGGQKQRIAIARALLKDPPILLLDEATSSLDSFSEEHVQFAINDLMKDRTTVIVTHRLSSIMLADKIFILDNGKIIDSGNHRELSNRSELYSELCKMQNIELNY
jgi:ABC-type multidrug transport system fused ATPase/permease subunit